MASTYGTDVKALDDLPDPEELATEEENAAYAVGRRLLTPEGTYEQIGDFAEYDSINLEDQFGQALDERQRLDLEARCAQVTSADERVATSQVTVAKADDGTLNTSIAAVGADGPFELINLSVNDVTAKLLRGS